MTKEYLEEQYKLGLQDLRLAKTEAEKAEALDALKKITDTATAIYGFDFVDQLQQEKAEKEGCNNG